MDWKTFWDRPNAIYVNDRHRAAHYAGIADDLVRLLPGEGAVVLDHGSGEALHADRIARACARLYLLDAASSVRTKLAERFAGEPNVAVLAPEDLAALPDQTFDLVVANSLLQYLSAAELDDCLLLWRAKLKPGGTLVLADVIPPDNSALADVRALLAFSYRQGFLGAALLGLARTALSPYRRLRRELGLATHSEAGLIALLGSAGFEARRAPHNIGHNPARMTFIAHPRS